MVDIATTPCNEVTVVLLGQGEIGHRARAQHYYQKSGIPCLSLEPLQANSTGELCRKGLEQVLQQVATPFVVLALDPDFVLAPALSRAVACLHEQPHAIAAQGYALGYVVGNAEVTYHKLGAATPGLEEEGARARLCQYGQAGRQAWRAVIRVSALQAVLASVPTGLDVAAFRLGLSYAVLAKGPIAQIEQTDVVCAREPAAMNPVLHGEQLNQALRDLRQWDAEHLGLCAGETGFAVLNRFVRETYGQGEAPVLFTSTWRSVGNDPERLFEPRQYIEMPYYNTPLFAQLTALEFLCHAWPAGQAQYQALEGCWVRQRDLLRVHPNDTAGSLELRYWQALALGLFDPQVCRQLVATLTGTDDAARAYELADWLKRLEQVPGIDQQQRLNATPSGKVLAALEAATPDSAALQQVQAHLGKRPAGQMAFVVLDLGNDDAALQATFDSVLACGMRNFKLVVLKGGQPPAITTARDTLHFIQVNESNWLAHLNQVVRQLPSEWLLLLRAGDELSVGGLLHLLVELAEAPACQAICANEIQRDEQGRLHAVIRPGADLNLLRSQPELMAPHWVVRRQAVLDLGGYSDTHRQALELDLLLRLAETQGLGCLAHLDDYLVIGERAPKALTEEAMAVVNRHLTQLGYRAQLREQQDAGLVIDFRHATTPLVSILVASEGDRGQLEACLTSVLQRTRYPRYEVLVVCADDELAALERFGGRVRLLSVEPAVPRNTRLNLAASEARGEYVVLLSARCQVTTPAWIEALLNEAQRPEVGVTGALLRGTDGALVHAGYALQAGMQVVSPWQGLSPELCAQVRWPHAVRSCPAVSGDCLMVRRDVFEQSDGLQAQPGADIDLCLRIGQAGLLVLWTPFAQLLDSAPNSVAAPQAHWLEVAAGLSAPVDASRGNVLAWLDGI